MSSSTSPSASVPPDTLNQNRDYRPYGEQYQFNERAFNPLPEAIFVAAASLPGAESTQHIAADGPGSAEDESKEASDGAAHAGPWYRTPKTWWYVAGITAIGTAFVILAILGAAGSFSRHSHGASETFSSESATTGVSAGSALSGSTAGSAMTFTSATATASGAPLATTCPGSSSFIPNVAEISIQDHFGDYSTMFSNTDSAQECCDYCFKEAKGCNAWLYNPSTSFTSCTYIQYQPNDSVSTAQCPYGYAEAAEYHRGGKFTAGYGPCSLHGFVNS